MTPADQIQQHLYLSSKTILEAYSQVNQIEAASKLLTGRRCIYLCGNGGSAADCQHFAAELIAGGVNARALTTDTSVITAIANDFGYEQVFSRQLMACWHPYPSPQSQKGLAIKQDALVVITTSGRSKNVLEAIRVARDHQVPIVALTGGGESWGLSEVAITVEGEIEHKQECFLSVEHILAKLIIRGKDQP